MNQLATIIDTTITDVTQNYVRTIEKHNHGLVFDSQLLAAKRQLMKSDFLMKIAANNPESTREAIMTAAVLGVDLTEGKRQGWLIPRSGKVVFQVGYKGIEAIHQKLGIVDRLSVRVVRENDDFEWSGDDAEKPSHKVKPTPFASDSERGNIIGAFCVTYYPDKTLHVVSASVSEIYEKHRDISDSWKKESARMYSPWTTHEKAMIEKTIAIIASKQWPAYKMSENDNVSSVLEKLHETETDDYQQAFVQPDTDPRFEIFMHYRNALGMYLLHQDYRDREDEQSIISFYNSFPKGRKMEMKEEMNQLVATGMEIFRVIEEAIEAEDAFLLSENLDDDKECKKLVAAKLGDEDTENIKKLLSSLDA